MLCAFGPGPRRRGRAEDQSDQPAVPPGRVPAGACAPLPRYVYICLHLFISDYMSGAALPRPRELRAALVRYHQLAGEHAPHRQFGRGDRTVVAHEDGHRAAPHGPLDNSRRALLRPAEGRHRAAGADVRGCGVDVRGCGVEELFFDPQKAATVLQARTLGAIVWMLRVIEWTLGTTVWMLGAMVWRSSSSTHKRRPPCCRCGR
eukprot:1182132-Prorocentrum_minimum.AAC.2